MREILNAMRAAAAGGSARVETSRIGIVRGYDPGTYSVKVDLQPEGSSTGWIPLGSVWVGSSWGLFSPPSLGDQVTVVFQEGDQSAPVAQLRLFDDGNRPLPCPSGEFWLVHKSGSLLKFHNDGSVELTSAANLTATVGGNMTATVSGNMTSTVTGTASITAGQAVIKATSIALQNAGTALKSLLNSLFANWAATHVHSNGNGGANTGVPTTPPPANGQTQTVQAE